VVVVYYLFDVMVQLVVRWLHDDCDDCDGNQFGD